MDEKLQTLLNNQVISEYGASMVYTQLAFEMDNLSFPGMRDWFMGQAAEEREHAEKIADHLLSRGYRVELNDIPVGSVKAATRRMPSRLPSSTSRRFPRRSAPSPARR